MTSQDFFERYQYDPERDKLGSGGFGTVYKALDTLRGRYVAIKESLVKDHQFTLQREVELSNEIEPHSNVLRYENVYRFNIVRVTMDYAVMKYFEKGNLESVLAHPLSILEKKQILEGILNGIAHLHKNDIIHRDLKIANILIDYQNGLWIPKICDFGLSRLVRVNEGNNISDSSVGLSIAYAAPEQIEAKRVIRKNTDLWSYGIIVYRTIMGELPFSYPKDVSERTAMIDISRQIVAMQLPDKINIVPEPFQSVLKKCLVYDTNERVQTADELMAVLQPPIIESPFLKAIRTHNVEFNAEETMFISPKMNFNDIDKTIVQQQSSNDITPLQTDLPDNEATIIESFKRDNKVIENDENTLILNKTETSLAQPEDATAILDKYKPTPTVSEDKTVILDNNLNKTDEKTLILDKNNPKNTLSDEATVVLPKESKSIYNIPQTSLGDDSTTIISKGSFSKNKRDDNILVQTKEGFFDSFRNKILIGVAGLVGLTFGILLVTSPAPTPIKTEISKQEIVPTLTTVVDTPQITPDSLSTKTTEDASIFIPVTVQKDLKKPNIPNTNVPIGQKPIVNSKSVPDPDNQTQRQPEEEVFKNKDNFPENDVPPSTKAHSTNKYNSNLKIYSLSELSTKPFFPNLLTYFKDKVQCPPHIKNKQASRTIYIQALIEIDGSITFEKVNQGLSPGCDASAIEVIRNMPIWKPGTYNGNVVRSRVSIKISLD